mgnify:CR=1 FL=1
MSQPSDKAIGNVNFPQFRADLNDGLDALFTNNSGSSEPAALADSDFAHYLDTTDNTFKIKDSTSGGTGTYLDLYKLQGGEVRLQGNITDTLPAIGSFDTAYAQARKSLQVDSAGTLSYGFAAPYRHHAQVIYVEESESNGHNYQGATVANDYVKRHFNYLEFDTGNQVSLNGSNVFGVDAQNLNRRKTTSIVTRSDASQTVKLKAGTHYIEAECFGHITNRQVLRFYNATQGVEAYIGFPSIIQYQKFTDNAVPKVTGRFTFDAETDLQVHQIVEESVAEYGQGFGYNGIPNLYTNNVDVVLARMEIWTV